MYLLLMVPIFRSTYDYDDDVLWIDIDVRWSVEFWSYVTQEVALIWLLGWWSGGWVLGKEFHLPNTLLLHPILHTR